MPSTKKKSDKKKVTAWKADYKIDEDMKTPGKEATACVPDGEAQLALSGTPDPDSGMTITYEQIPWTPPAKPDDGGDKTGKSGKMDDPDGYARIAAEQPCKHKEEKSGCVDGYRCGGL